MVRLLCIVLALFISGCEMRVNPTPAVPEEIDVPTIRWQDLIEFEIMVLPAAPTSAWLEAQYIRGHELLSVVPVSERKFAVYFSKISLDSTPKSYSVIRMDEPPTREDLDIWKQDGLSVVSICYSPPFFYTFLSI